MRSEMQDLPQPNWFHHGELILPLLEQHRPMRCVELGSNRGCSAIAVARLIRTWGGRLTCVDLWSPGPVEEGFVNIGEFINNIRDAKVADTITVICGRSDTSAQHWIGGEIDYLYIDADHTFEGCSADLEMWWPFLKVGGLIAGDDYDDPHGDPQRGVTRAWDDFERKHQQEFVRVENPYIAHASRLIWGVKR